MEPLAAQFGGYVTGTKPKITLRWIESGTKAYEQHKNSY